MRSSLRKDSTPYKGGSRFVVWAPNADDVFVIGTFNDWDKTGHQITKNPTRMVVNRCARSKAR
jgi:1,4-alpha-glucan branching enzyme